MSGLIEVRGVSLEIPVFDAGRSGLRRTILKRVAQAAGHRLGGGASVIRALNDLTFRIGWGERVALFGRNGAGKTTLLNVLAGVLVPSHGTVRVCGRVSTLLALVDPDGEGTVVENIRLSGLLRGVRGGGLRRLVDDVLDFAELEAYAQMPVRVLSSGMRMRLSYGVATAIACDVLLVDEIIGVGDAGFLKKASLRFRDAARDIAILVLATHAIGLAQEFCSRALLLDGGTLRAEGPLSEIADLYLQSVAEQPVTNT